MNSTASTYLRYVSNINDLFGLDGGRKETNFDKKSRCLKFCKYFTKWLNTSYY